MRKKKPKTIKAQQAFLKDLSALCDKHDIYLSDAFVLYYCSDGECQMFNLHNADRNGAAMSEWVWKSDKKVTVEK